MNSQTKTLAVINDQRIQVVENGDTLVPIRPICHALGIDFSRQKEKIESDEILGSTIGLAPMVAGDNKEREMFCIPFRYVFGWLFTINPKNVKEEARETVIRYRMECYNALYDHFSAHYRELEESIKESARRRSEIEALERKLFENEDYQLLETLKLAERQAAYRRGKENRHQLEIFKEMYSENDHPHWEEE